MKKLIVGLTAGMLIGSAATAFAAEDVAKEVKALLGSFSFKVNGVEKKLETTPLVYEGSAYLPVREVAKLTGYELDYKEETRTIELKANSPSAPPASGAAQEKPKAAAEEQTQSKKDAALGDGAKAGSTADNKTDNKSKAKAGEGNWVALDKLQNALKRSNIPFGTGYNTTGLDDVSISFELSYNLDVYKLEKQDGLIDITPMIQAGIVKLEAGEITVNELKKTGDKPDNNPKVKAGEGNWVTLPDLLGALNKKKLIDTNKSVLASTDPVSLDIKGTVYNLKDQRDGGDFLVDITPLIQAQIITLDDAKRKKEAVPGDGAKAGSTAENKTDSKPKAKAGEGNWVKFNDLQAALDRKKSSNARGGSSGGSNDGHISIVHNGVAYKLNKQGDYNTAERDNREKFLQDIIVDITPLIEARIVTLDEVKNK